MVLNIHVQVLYGHNIFISLGCIHKSRIVGSYGNSMFNFLRNFKTVFQSGYYLNVYTHAISDQKIKIKIYFKSKQVVNKIKGLSSFFSMK